MLARHVRSEKLWERETKERTALITMLRNEDEYYSGLVAAQRKKVIMLEAPTTVLGARRKYVFGPIMSHVFSRLCVLFVFCFC